MKKTYIILGIILLSSFASFSQLEKGTKQIGASALPIFDVFHLFPQNEIKGVGVSANFGFFAAQRLSIGVNPFYAQVYNSYPIVTIHSNYRSGELLRFYGLNFYGRYHLLDGGRKLKIYSSLQLGLGNLNKKPDNESIKQTNAPVFVSSFGLGTNYFLTESIALELNIPILLVNDLSGKTSNFFTFAPTLGLQCFFK